MTKDGLYLGSINCGNKSTNDDRSCENEKRRSIWERRSNKITKKRKEKAAISVRRLHNLQEIARPSDAKLFYADVEKEIETVTAAILEGFVAIKTRTIHNSVKQWADRTVIRVKSVIGWFRTGGKKNREKIERSRNRQRIQFKNEQYKKPREKTRSSDSTVSTMRQQSLCGFISLNNYLS